MPSDKVSQGVLPGLVGIAAAIVMWWLAEPLREQGQGMRSEIATLRSGVSRNGPEPLKDLQIERDAAAARRASLQMRLDSEASLQMARAGLYYDIREKCSSIRLTCLIRLSDTNQPTAGAGRTADRARTLNEATARGTDATAETDVLLDLGVVRARAVVSGNFAEQEPLALVRLFQQDPGAQWRVNRWSIKGSAFELDVERHLIVNKTK